MTKEEGDICLRPEQSTPNPLRYILLNECLGAPAEVDIRDFVRQNDLQFRFDMDSSWYCLTGVGKEIFQDAYGMDQRSYSKLYRDIERNLGILLSANGWTGEVFPSWKEDENLISVIMSPGKGARCDALTMAETIHACVQQTYEQELFKGDGRYRNTTALVGPGSGYDAIRENYRRARALKELFFFPLEDRVLTEEKVARRRIDADYATVFNASIEMWDFLDDGSFEQAMGAFRRLHAILRDSCRLGLFDDALSFFKGAFQIRCTAYDAFPSIPLDVLCCRRSYHSAEECFRALLSALKVIGDAMAEQGIVSKVVLNSIYYIRTNYSHYLTLTEIARYVKTNASYLSSMFKEETGLSVRNYINKVRLDTAQKLLLDTDETVIQIAWEVGFEDVRYFTRVFKQSLDCTPTEYRRQHGKLIVGEPPAGE